MRNFHKDGVNDEKLFRVHSKIRFLVGVAGGRGGVGVNEKPKSLDKLQSMSMSWHKLHLVHLTVNAENLV